MELLELKDEEELDDWLLEEELLDGDDSKLEEVELCEVELVGTPGIEVNAGVPQDAKTKVERAPKVNSSNGFFMSAPSARGAHYAR